MASMYTAWSTVTEFGVLRSTVTVVVARIAWLEGEEGAGSVEAMRRGALRWYPHSVGYFIMNCLPTYGIESRCVTYLYSGWGNCTALPYE